MQIADEMEQEFESHHLLFEVSCRVRKLGSELTGPPKAMTIKMPHIVKPGDDKRAADFIAGAALRAIPTTEPAAAQDTDQTAAGDRVTAPPAEPMKRFTIDVPSAFIAVLKRFAPRAG
jgi:hypothetical protein